MDTNFLERYPLDKRTGKKSVQFENDKNSIEINCRDTSQVGLIEHIIEEVDIGDCIPSTSIIEDGSQVIEVVPDINADREESSFREVETTSKWTSNITFTFLETIKAVLVEEEISGGYLSRKNIFEKVAELLKEHEFNISSGDAEKKYNNMLMTYRRCQKRLIQRKQAPLWPYFKLFEEIRNKDIQLNNIPSEIVPKKRKLTPESLPPLMMRKEQHNLVTEELPITLLKDPSGWKEKRSQLNQRKQSFIEGLLTSAKDGRKKDDNLRITLREADEIEIEYLSALKTEVHKTANVMTEGLKTLKTSLQELKNILVNI